MERVHTEIVQNENTKSKNTLGAKSDKRNDDFKTQKTKTNAGKLMKLLQQQDFRCALSGVQLTPDVAVIDHKTPVSKGGGNEIENLQWLHVHVNKAKGAIPQDEFVAMCRRVSMYQS